ncbi:MAG: GyrI-like domain-containing protein [Myxococcota bacterium]
MPAPRKKSPRKPSRSPTKKTASTRRPASAAKRNGLLAPPELLQATAAPDVVDVPKRTVLAIDGAGSPDSAEFARSIGALYGLAYTLKFSRKRSGGDDFKVGPLEGLWSADVPRGFIGTPPRDAWLWRLRLPVPDDVTTAILKTLVAEAVAKKGGKLFGSQEARKVTLERIPRRRMGRILHVGPYVDEPASFEKMRAMLATQRLTPAHPHLEIYLSDPFRTAPSKLRTVLLKEALPAAR